MRWKRDLLDALARLKDEGLESSLKQALLLRPPAARSPHALPTGYKENQGGLPKINF